MRKFLWLAAAPLLLAAAQDSGPRATLEVRQADGSFRAVDRYAVPESHRSGDGSIASEGPVWRNGVAAYRLDLVRNVPDLAGGSPLDTGRSLGLGGIGVLRDGRATQLGPSLIAVRLFESPRSATVVVDNQGFAGAGGKASLSATYRIFAGSRLTHVEARVTGKVPAMVAGIALRADAGQVDSPKKKPWRYIATWGERDRLGVALFYPSNEAEAAGDDGRSLYVRFCDPRHLRYAFAAWEPGTDGGRGDFRKWLAESADALATRPQVIPAGQKLCPRGG